MNQSSPRPKTKAPKWRLGSYSLLVLMVIGQYFVYLISAMSLWKPGSKFVWLSLSPSIVMKAAFYCYLPALLFFVTSWNFPVIRFLVSAFSKLLFSVVVGFQLVYYFSQVTYAPDYALQISTTTFAFGALMLFPDGLSDLHRAYDESFAVSTDHETTTELIANRTALKRLTRRMLLGMTLSNFPLIQAIANDITSRASDLVSLGALIALLDVLVANNVLFFSSWMKIYELVCEPTHSNQRYEDWARIMQLPRIPKVGSNVLLFITLIPTAILYVYIFIIDPRSMLLLPTYYPLMINSLVAGIYNGLIYALFRVRLI